MAYNLLDLRSRVRIKIKDSSYAASTIDGFINDAIVEISQLYPWKYFGELRTSDTLTIGSDTFANPTDHDITAGLILVDPSDTTKYWNLTNDRMNYEAFFALYPNASVLDNSQPVYWTEYGNTIYFNCPADKAYLVRQLHQKTPTELSGDSDVPELPQTFREAIVLGATYRCEGERGNDDIAAVRQNQFNDRVSDQIMRLSNDTMAGPDTVVMPGRKHGSDWD
jgi:hypothetical protein